MKRQVFRRRAVPTVLVAGLVAVLSGCPSLFGGDDNGDLATYTVSYEANGAQSGTAPADQTKSEGVDLTLANNSGNLARTGFTFLGWNTADDGSGTGYAAGATYRADADVTLYAEWTVNIYTVTFNLQGGTGGSTSVSATFGQQMPAATAPTNGDAVFDGYYTEADGAGTQYYTAAMESARDWDLPADTELFASWHYSVGDTGPAGGIVFHDKGSYSDGWRYLEAWTADESETYGWKTSTSETTGTSTDVGSGYENTYSAMTGSEHPAAEVVRNATHGGYSDWFLPSKDELNKMYEQRGDIGGFDSAVYWSSSEYSANGAWSQSFGTGSQPVNNKFSEGGVRAARRF